ncbi:MAG: RluA family pseudouridine synthase [Polyangia bacterium]
MAERARRGGAVARSPADGGPAGITLAAALRARFPEQSWNAVRRLCQTGKVRLGGALTLDPAARVSPDAAVTIDMAAPRPVAEVVGFRVVFEDAHLIVIEKPAGVSSVPYERRETGTALDLIRAHWRARKRQATATPLYTVHRLDKETSGLLCFAKTKAGEHGLHQIFQRHLATRAYLTVVHGAATGGRIESRLVPDRGDGLRGSTRDPRQEKAQHAVTHVEVLERLSAATYCRVRLETGRTHQIRIHLSESGHPVVGDAVYNRDLLTSGGRALPSERLMLHATTLGFDHPVSGERLDFVAEPPADFLAALGRLGFRGGRPA